MVAMTPIPATAAAAEIFPSMRKKLRQAKALTQVDPAKKEEAQPTKKDAVPAPGVVPDAVDVGTNGFPQLPEVSAMLNDAMGTLKTVNSQASGLQAKVVQVQMQSEAKMAKQKAAFEMKLKQQEQGNLAVIQANANISATIKQLKSDNTALKKRARETQETNRVMRTELHALQSRLVTAKTFTDDSLKNTDDSKNALLQVIQGGGAHHRHHHALVETSSVNHEVDDDDDDEESDDDKSDDSDDEDSDEGESFLSMSSKTHRSFDGATSFNTAMDELEAVSAVSNPVEAAAGAPPQDPNDLLEVLAKQVAQLAKQEKESEKNLKNLFIKDFRAGAKRHQALLVQQKSLIGVRGELLSLQSQLKDALAHLEATRKQLEGRLHGLGKFFQQMAHFAMAPQREVPHLMEVLPKDVNFNTKAK
jgi:regulator of replication initiation timing